MVYNLILRKFGLGKIKRGTFKDLPVRDQKAVGNKVDILLYCEDIKVGADCIKQIVKGIPETGENAKHDSLEDIYKKVREIRKEIGEIIMTEC